jgi:hypothetical protein
MSQQIWNIERDARLGVRATVKVYPTGVELVNGMRYRRLCGPWVNTGNESRDFYKSEQALRQRLAAIESAYQCAPSARSALTIRR